MLTLDTSQPPIYLWPQPTLVLTERGHLCNPNKLSWLNIAPETLKWGSQSVMESTHNQAHPYMHSQIINK